jgi:sugar/nucleoside kinase (ribokinase family)
VPALEVEVADTTGAGDALTGAFLAVWLNTGDAELAGRYGCAAGSLAVTAYGAQGILPDAGLLERYLMHHTSLQTASAIRMAQPEET